MYTREGRPIARQTRGMAVSPPSFYRIRNRFFFYMIAFNFLIYFLYETPSKQTFITSCSIRIRFLHAELGTQADMATNQLSAFSGMVDM